MEALEVYPRLSPVQELLQFPSHWSVHSYLLESSSKENSHKMRRKWRVAVNAASCGWKAYVQ